MASICFVGPYPPIMCGIATYTSYLTNGSPDGKWGVLSFDLTTYGAPLTDDAKGDHVWYGIPSRSDFSASHILKGLDQLNLPNTETVLWFQHETAIWDPPQKFIAMLKQLNMPKVVSFHTLHFQSDETPSGLRQCQYDLLRDLLPYVDAITVFTYGVYRAVISAFPEYYAKIYVTKHGIHSYPEISRMRRKEAREKLHDFLLYESDLDQSTKKFLHEHHTLLDPDAIIVGQTGFLCPSKFSESLYFARDNLQGLIPNKRIVAMRIGTAREESQKAYTNQLRAAFNDTDSFLLETWLPPDILPLAQRAFDINFYWPEECTQSGVVAHALGAGAIVAGRDLEGVGETLREAGQVADTDMNNLIMKIKHLVLDSNLLERSEEKALNYAKEFSWEKQALRHYELIEPIVHTALLWEKSRMPSAIDSIAALTARQANQDLPVHSQQLPKDTMSPTRKIKQRFNPKSLSEFSIGNTPNNFVIKPRKNLLSQRTHPRKRGHTRNDTP
ncbi:MAG: hypothetical protein HQ553_13950 [Chloroflexi bacterium]|nr:hypothetical protein [Chloroflexota bacterium]